MSVKLKTHSPALIVACIALLVALGPAVHAANTVFSTDIVDGEVKTADLADSAVTFAKLAPNSVRTGNVANNSNFSSESPFKGRTARAWPRASAWPLGKAATNGSSNNCWKTSPSSLTMVQMIYFDPPYGVKYGSNFQPFAL